MLSLILYFAASLTINTQDTYAEEPKSVSSNSPLLFIDRGMRHFLHQFPLNQDGSDSQRTKNWMEAQLPRYLSLGTAPFSWVHANTINPGVWMVPIRHQKGQDLLTRSDLLNAGFYKSQVTSYFIGQIKTKAIILEESALEPRISEVNHRIFELWLEKNDKPNRFSTNLTSDLIERSLPWHSEFFREKNILGYKDGFAVVVVNFNAFEQMDLHVDEKYNKGQPLHIHTRATSMVTGLCKSLFIP